MFNPGRTSSTIIYEHFIAVKIPRFSISRSHGSTVTLKMSCFISHGLSSISHGPKFYFCVPSYFFAISGP